MVSLSASPKEFSRMARAVAAVVMERDNLPDTVKPETLAKRVREFMDKANNGKDKYKLPGTSNLAKTNDSDLANIAKQVIRMSNLRNSAAEKYRQGGDHVQVALQVYNENPKRKEEAQKASENGNKGNNKGGKKGNSNNSNNNNKNNNTNNKKDKKAEKKERKQWVERVKNAYPENDNKRYGTAWRLFIKLLTTDPWKHGSNLSDTFTAQNLYNPEPYDQFKSEIQFIEKYADDGQPVKKAFRNRPEAILAFLETICGYCNSITSNYVSQADDRKLFIDNMTNITDRDFLSKLQTSLTQEVENGFRNGHETRINLDKCNGSILNDGTILSTGVCVDGNIILSFYDKKIKMYLDRQRVKYSMYVSADLAWTKKTYEENLSQFVNSHKAEITEKVNKASNQGATKNQLATAILNAYNWTMAEQYAIAGNYIISYLDTVLRNIRFKDRTVIINVYANLVKRLVHSTGEENILQTHYDHLINILKKINDTLTSGALASIKSKYFNEVIGGHIPYANPGQKDDDNNKLIKLIIQPDLFGRHDIQKIIWDRVHDASTVQGFKDIDVQPKEKIVLWNKSPPDITTMTQNVLVKTIYPILRNHLLDKGYLPAFQDYAITKEMKPRLLAMALLSSAKRLESLDYWLSKPENMYDVAAIAKKYMLYAYPPSASTPSDGDELSTSYRQALGINTGNIISAIVGIEFDQKYVENFLISNQSKAQPETEKWIEWFGPPKKSQKSTRSELNTLVNMLDDIPAGAYQNNMNAGVSQRVRKNKASGGAKERDDDIVKDPHADIAMKSNESDSDDESEYEPSEFDKFLDKFDKALERRNKELAESMLSEMEKVIQDDNDKESYQDALTDFNEQFNAPKKKRSNKKGNHTDNSAMSADVQEEQVCFKVSFFFLI